MSRGSPRRTRASGATLMGRHPLVPCASERVQRVERGGVGGRVVSRRSESRVGRPPGGGASAEDVAAPVACAADRCRSRSAARGRARHALESPAVGAQRRLRLVHRRGPQPRGAREADHSPRFQHADPVPHSGLSGVHRRGVRGVRSAPCSGVVLQALLSVGTVFLIRSMPRGVGRHIGLSRRRS